MEFGYAPGLTEEDMADIKRHHEMADRMVAEQKINPPTEYFKGERFMGGKFYPPGVTPPESFYDRMVREGKIKI
ncbi:MAG: hypothetical protein HQL63_14815 [Magnetococcales bacterium]|nr:hypothetical protein [Magnetococcales bacterium]MBF0322732.1 hypothetical protein [Magnetococcales bacterium]